MSPEVFIAAKSKRQAREWGLVLLSQGLEVGIEERPGEGWGICLAEADEPAARLQVETYESENRGWRWRHPIAAGGVWFHAGAIGWSLLLMLIHLLDGRVAPSLRSLGMVDSSRIVAGEWWRLFTATFLHGDAAHLMANAITGFMLLGLAMARYGSGTALFLTFLGGTMGNLLGFLVYRSPHYGLGASGVVMAALGLIAVPWKNLPSPGGFMASAIPVLGGGLLLFVLLGTDPSTDVLAHAGGFFAGIALGHFANRIKIKKPRQSAWDRLAFFAWLTLLLLVWGLAFS